MIRCVFSIIYNGAQSLMASNQMTKKVEECDSILRIRAKVDSHGAYIESLALDEDEEILDSEAQISRISLCSSEKTVSVAHVLSTMQHKLNLHNFTACLANFFRAQLDIKVSQKYLAGWAVSGFLVQFHGYPH